MMNNVRNMLFTAALVFFVISSVELSAGSWVIPDEIIGTWCGKSDVSLPRANEKSEVKPQQSMVSVQISIGRDGTVNGQIGKAVFAGCVVRKNRNTIEKMFNLKSDFIICDGTLEGCIQANDSESSKRFTIPFNIVDNQLKGSFMLLKSWEYPYPMLRLKLDKLTDK